MGNGASADHLLDCLRIWCLLLLLYVAYGESIDLRRTLFDHCHRLFLSAVLRSNRNQRTLSWLLCLPVDTGRRWTCRLYSILLSFGENVLGDHLCRMVNHWCSVHIGIAVLPCLSSAGSSNWSRKQTYLSLYFSFGSHPSYFHSGLY